MNKFIWMLKLAYAIEIGAYHAYKGHRNSVPKTMSLIRAKLLTIQIDELCHRHAVGKMLGVFSAKPSKILNALLWCIGKSIGLACHVIGFAAAMWGAKIMEIMGSDIYGRLAEEAYWNELSHMGRELSAMGKKEKEHGLFFAQILEIKRGLKP